MRSDLMSVDDPLGLNLVEELPESHVDRMNQVNDHCKDEVINATDAKDKERAFKMLCVTHTILTADEGASEEALVRNFMLSKSGMVSLLKDRRNLDTLYKAFEEHVTLRGAHHLLLSPEGFVAQLRRIAQKANKALLKHTGVPSYLKKKE